MTNSLFALTNRLPPPTPAMVAPRVSALSRPLSVTPPVELGVKELADELRNCRVLPVELADRVPKAVPEGME